MYTPPQSCTVQPSDARQMWSTCWVHCGIVREYYNVTRTAYSENPTNMSRKHLYKIDPVLYGASYKRLLNLLYFI